MDIAIDVVKGIATFFIHPIVYIGILYALWMGILRVKKERHDFHSRIYDFIDDVKTTLAGGLLAGLLLSIALVVAGVVLAPKVLVTIGIIYFLFMLTFQVRLLSPAYTLPFVVLAMYILDWWKAPFYFFTQQDLSAMLDWTVNVALLFAVLLLVEGFLILSSAHKKVSPRIFQGKRGKYVGALESKRLWLLPLVLVVPSGQLPEWLYWPLLSPTVSEGYGVVMVPFFIGFSQLLFSGVASLRTKEIGRKVGLLGVIVLALVLGAYFYWPLVIVSAAVAIIGREVIFQFYKQKEKNSPRFFTPKGEGVVVLGIIPGSSAEKMGLLVGESIVKVNGTAVNSPTTFYEALQRNSAFCKLEVIDINGEKRFAQSALYAGEHYQIGVVFVKEELQLKDSIV
ncbi:PDZ domain-containing protein [Bacillus alkalicellulosilyticus]|uniref:PDZ domain-containing protein n=1 Tax=Alkalihalobacterium alkalicellulosilyticum TaxID=1912214 RepID=UPI000998401C|nr:PDZ domain-containing protein [Bacillus alkalicellulosilyticus]